GVALVAGCTEQDVTPGNSALGIDHFEITESSHLTTVVGVGADDQEVARLELIHGRFTISEFYKENYPDQTELEGRKLDVTMWGKKSLIYEAPGYSPVMHLPPHPASEIKLEMLLTDPTVKPILDHWGIGFTPIASPDVAQVDTVAYGYGVWEGTDYTD